jgi:hypothetical protein
MAMLGRWLAWCQLSWRSVGRNGLNERKQGDWYPAISSGGKPCGVVPSHPESQAPGNALEHLRAATEASTPLPARCDHLVIVAGVNVTGQSSCCLAPGRGSMVAWARAFDAADRPAPRLFLGTLHLRT